VEHHRLVAAAGDHHQRDDGDGGVVGAAEVAVVDHRSVLHSHSRQRYRLFHPYFGCHLFYDHRLFRAELVVVVVVAVRVLELQPRQ